MLAKGAVLAVLLSSVVANFDVTFPPTPQGDIRPEQLGQLCGNSDDKLPRYLWHPKGSPLGLNQHQSNTLLEINYCQGNSCTSWEDFSDVVLGSHIQTHLGNICLPRVAVPGEVSSYGTLQILYRSEDTYLTRCIDVVISEQGPEWDGSNCANDTGVDLGQKEDFVDLRTEERVLSGGAVVGEIDEEDQHQDQYVNGENHEQTVEDLSSDDSPPPPPENHMKKFYTMCAMMATGTALVVGFLW